MQNKFKGFRSFLKEKGYYIALMLCTAVVGVTGYSLLKHKGPTVNTDPTKGSLPTVQVIPGTTAPSGGKPAVNMEGEQEATLAPTEVQTPFRLRKPVSGEILKDAAVDHLAYNPTTRDWRTHDGIDVAAEAGTQVCAAADGVVSSVYSDDALGMTVVISHEDGYSTKYACLAEEVLVQPGDSVKMGDAIGTVGQTALMESALGDHLHFSVTREDKAVDPADFLSIGK